MKFKCQTQKYKTAMRSKALDKEVSNRAIKDFILTSNRLGNGPGGRNEGFRFELSHIPTCSPDYQEPKDEIVVPCFPEALSLHLQ